MPHLQVLQDKYAKTGKFTVIGSHVQAYNKKAVDALLKQSKVNFPHYQQLRITKAPCGRGIPHMVLFDHEGNVVGNGHINNLESEIKKYIKLAPNPGDISPMVGDLEIKFFQREQKNLMPGKPVKSTLGQLERKAEGDSDEAKEAKAIIEAVNNWGKSELEAAEKLKSSAPTEAYSKLYTLNRTFYGMPLVNDVTPWLTEMKKDKYFTYLLGLRKQYDNLKSSKDVSESNKKSLISRFQAFIDKYPASEALKSEAADVIKQIDKL